MKLLTYLTILPPSILLSSAIFAQTAQNIDGIWLADNTHCYARQISVGPDIRVHIVCENQDDDWLYLFTGEKTFNPDGVSSYDTGVSLNGSIIFLPKGSRSLRRDNVELSIVPSTHTIRASSTSAFDSAPTLKIRHQSGLSEIQIPAITLIPINDRHIYQYDRRTKFRLREEVYPVIANEEDITGVWYGNDGGVYYVSQYGNSVAWFAEHPEGYWSNSAIGIREGNRITLNWADVPKGAGSGFGFIVLELENKVFMHRSSSGAGFGGTTWRRNSDTRPVSLKVMGGQFDHQALCPHDYNTSEDLEFAGNGPEVTMTAELNIEPVHRASLQAKITFHAQETGDGGSSVSGEWTETVYQAPAGRTIRRIISDDSSELVDTSPPGGYETPGGGRTPHRQDNEYGFVSDERVNTVELEPGELVKYFSYVGDTGALDISTDNNCIKETALQAVEFNTAMIELTGLPRLTEPDIDVPNVPDPNDPINRYPTPRDNLRTDGN